MREWADAATLRLNYLSYKEEYHPKSPLHGEWKSEGKVTLAGKRTKSQLDAATSSIPGRNPVVEDQCKHLLKSLMQTINKQILVLSFNSLSFAHVALYIMYFF